MSVFTGIDREILLTGLVSDAVFDFTTKHHLVALHEVDHDILKLWRTIADLVEENLLISNDLNPHVTLDKVNEASHWYVVEHFPRFFLCQFFLDLFEEHDSRGRSSGQHGVIDQVHLPEIGIVTLFEPMVKAIWFLT